MLLRYCIFKIIILCIISNHLNCTIISSSTIQKCYNSSLSLTNNNSTTSVSNCSNKILLSMSLDNDQAIATESAIFTLNSVINQTDQQTVNLKNPIQLQVTKSQVQAFYPLKYLQDFNNKPIEKVISCDIFSCEDAQYADTATCGFAVNAQQQRIMYSQGFCCACSFSEIIGLSSANLNRGNICQALNLGDGASTAHCLRFDPLWYAGYEIGTPILTYNITVSLNYTQSMIQQVQKFNLGSSTQVGHSSDYSVIAQVIGDFYPQPPPPALESFALLRPISPSNDPRVLQGLSQWMVVRFDQLTLDGSACDKIGVNFQAFYQQSQRCDMAVQTCLANQVQDLYDADVQRIKNNQSALYLLKSKGNFQAYDNLILNETTLSLLVQGKYASLISIELNADKIEFVENLGVAKFDFIQVPTFAANSEAGALKVMFTNTGNIPAKFILEFSCGSDVQAIAAQIQFLNSNTSQVVDVPIRVTLESNDTNHTCEAFLKNAIGTVVDQQSFNFSTTALAHFSNQLNGSSTQQNTGNVGVQPNVAQADCSSICPTFYNIFCAFANGCWEQVLKVALVFAIFILLVCCCCKGWFNPTRCCRGILSPKRLSQQKKSYRRQHQTSTIDQNKQQNNGISKFNPVNPINLIINEVQDQLLQNKDVLNLENTQKQQVNFSKPFSLKMQPSDDVILAHKLEKQQDKRRHQTPQQNNRKEFTENDLEANVTKRNSKQKQIENNIENNQNQRQLSLSSDEIEDEEVTPKQKGKYGKSEYYSPPLIKRSPVEIMPSVTTLDSFINVSPEDRIFKEFEVKIKHHFSIPLSVVLGQQGTVYKAIIKQEDEKQLRHMLKKCNVLNIDLFYAKFLEFYFAFIDNSTDQGKRVSCKPRFKLLKLKQKNKSKIK